MNLKQESPNLDNIVRIELRRIRSLFANDDDLLNALKGPKGNENRGFAKIDRTTIHRWYKPNDPSIPLPHRAHLAVQILRSELLNRSQCPVVRLRIAHHSSIVAASTFLTYAKPTSKTHKGELSALERYKTRGDPTKTETGIASLECLVNGDADIAIAHVGLLTEDHIKRSCQQLCRVSTALPSGISSRNIEDIEHLRNLSFGFPSKTNIGKNISQTLQQRLGYHSEDADRKLVECKEFSDAARFFLEDKIQCIIAWKEWVGHAEKMIMSAPSKMRCNPIPSRFFMPMEFAAYVNLACAPPEAIRAFLLALKDVNGEINSSFHESLLSIGNDEIQAAFDMKKGELEVEKKDREATFILADLHEEATLFLWQQEAQVASIRKSIFAKRKT